jgi:nucleotide-binding universal stress UspA family protein
LSSSTIRSALIATDFSAEAIAATRRAARIASEAGLHGVLVHVLPGPLPAQEHLNAAARAQAALELVAEELKGEGLRFEPRLLSGYVVGELARLAGQFDLVVAGARGQDALRDFYLGRTSLRLVRESPCPVLIVKRPADEGYRRVLAAVDFSAPSLAAASKGVQLAPNAQFDLLNAFEVPFESALRRAGVEEHKLQSYRLRAEEEAIGAMRELAQRLPVTPERVSMYALHGYPAKVISDRATQIGAQLVVIGKHAAGVVERTLIGSVSLQVLERAPCDVLVVPENAA